MVSTVAHAQTAEMPRRTICRSRHCSSPPPPRSSASPAAVAGSADAARRAPARRPTGRPTTATCCAPDAARPCPPTAAGCTCEADRAGRRGVRVADRRARPDDRRDREQHGLRLRRRATSWSGSGTSARPRRSRSCPAATSTRSASPARRSTPPRTGLVYVAAEFGSPVRHRLFALHVGNGRDRLQAHARLPRRRDRRDAGTRRPDHRRRPGLGAVRRPGRRLRRLQGPGGRLAARPARARAIALHRPDRPRGRHLDAARPDRRTVRATCFVSVGNGASGLGDRTTTATRCCSSSTRRAPARLVLAVDLGQRQRRRPRPRLAGPGARRSNKWVFSGRQVGHRVRAAPRRTSAASAARSSRRQLCTSFGGTAVRRQRRLRAVHRRRARGAHRAERRHARAVARVARRSPARRSSAAAWSGRSTPGAGVLHALGTGARRRPRVGVGRVGDRFATPALSGRRILVGTTSPG